MIVFILLLLLLGIVMVYFSVRLFYRSFPSLKGKIIPILSLVTILSCWVVSGRLYYAKSKFIWLGLNWLRPTFTDFSSFWNLLAMFLFIVAYPLALWLGIQAGYLLFGRSEKQVGLSDFFFPNKKDLF